MQHPDEGTIHAWLDGQLPQEEAAEVEAHTATCAECAAIVAEARGLIAASSRIVSALDIVPAGVIPERILRKRPWYATAQFRAAAAVAFFAAASMIVLRDRSGASLEDSAARVVASSRLQVEQTQAPATASGPAAQRDANRSASSANKVAADQATSRRVAGKSAAKVSEQDEAGSEAAASVSPPPALAAAAAVAPEPLLRAEPVVVTAQSARSQFANADAVSLEVVRADSGAANVKVTVYRVAAGQEVTLTESAPSPTATAMRARELRTSKVGAASTGAAGAVQAMAAPAPSAPRRDSAESLPVESITWNSQAGSTYTLSGRLSRARLEEIRKQIELVKPAAKQD